jgi:hypothetical protein
VCQRLFGDTCKRNSNQLWQREEAIILRIVFISLCALGFGFTIFTHYYRPPLEEQFADLIVSEPVGEVYSVVHKDQSSHDSFSMELYENIRSVDNAVDYLRFNYPNASEKELARAAFDLVCKRFVHYMYPRHTFLTNPYLAFLGLIMPSRTFDAMYLAADLLRHSAGASCGQAAAVFIEIWRELGGQARIHHLEGHDIAEAMVGGKLYVVDPDLEAMAPYSIKELRSNPILLEEVYSHISEPGVVDGLKSIFIDPNYWHYEFDEPPATSPRIYLGQLWINRLKFAVFPLLAMVFLFILRLRKHRV